MAAEALPKNSLEISLRRLELCTYAIQEIHMEIQCPQDPEARADILIASENLAFEVLGLLQTVRFYTWGEDDPEFVAPEDQEDAEL
jgi:hypothetical protein